ncbi:MAG TPA: hypothetical protein VKF35_04190 [Hyphomicrobiaceae bacterium]|jgi:hypothetical protein|nr:hypothetical protein [Hyphomicrobiaceae bacterium]
MSKSRVVGFGVAVAVLAGGALGLARVGMAEVPNPEQTPPAAEAPAPTTDDGIKVTAPNAKVAVDKARGRVEVRAPHSKVDVDADAGQVRVRVPYVNLDVHW